MACFIVPAAEAVVTTIIGKVKKTREEKKPEAKAAETINEAKVPFSRKLRWLTNMLWGGSILLAFEHLWHGEVVPFFPFLTAASEGPEAVSEMLGEMATVGVCMALLITAVWVGMLIVSKVIEKRAPKEEALPQEG